MGVMLISPEKTILTGMTQADVREGQREVLSSAYGFGILFHNFRGKLETEADLAPELEARSWKKGKLSYLRIQLNENTHSRLEHYAREFGELGYDAFYGMNNRPRFGEGSGCSAFAVSFLEIAGLFTKNLESFWLRNFLVPDALIGGPGIGKGRRVFFPGLIRAGKWANVAETHEVGSLFDPDLMHQWVEKMRLESRGNPDSLYRTEEWNAAQGVSFDATTIPTPDEPLFHF